MTPAIGKIQGGQGKTTIQLKTLKCHKTEDITGADECELRIWIDGSRVAVLRKSLNDGKSWTLNKTYQFSQNAKIQLWDRDDPGFPLYDNHDHLGTVTINPASRASTKALKKFTRDGANYTLTLNISSPSKPAAKKNVKRKVPRKKIRRKVLKKSKVYLKTLRCNSTEDITGADECELRVWVDGKRVATLRKSLNDRQTWTLNKWYHFTRHVKIDLLDRDNPGFPLYDSHDHLGTVFMTPTSVQKYTRNFSQKFSRDEASYTLKSNLTPGDNFLKIDAHVALNKFKLSKKAGKWTNISKATLLTEIAERIDDPFVMDQLNQSLCGPMATLVAMAMKDPALYVKMARDIYEKGKFQVPGQTVQPTNKSLFKKKVPKRKNASGVVVEEMPQVDWMLAASMRDWANAVFDFDPGDQFAGITTPGEMKEWMKIIVGCRRAEVDKTLIMGEKDALRVARDAIRAGNVAALMVDSDYLPDTWVQHAKTVSREPSNPTLNYPTHWVLLLDVKWIKSNSVKFKIFTWGGTMEVSVNEDRFEDIMWGSVVGYF